MRIETLKCNLYACLPIMLHVTVVKHKEVIDIYSRVLWSVSEVPAKSCRHAH